MALVVTSAERARDLRRSPALITAAAQGAGADQMTMTSYYRDDMTGLPEMGVVGGQLGEAYIHGMNGIAEAVRQIRGTSANQLASVRNVLVTAGTGVPTSGLVLSAE